MTERPPRHGDVTPVADDRGKWASLSEGWIGGVLLAVALGVSTSVWLPWTTAVLGTPSPGLSTELVATDLAMFQRAALEAEAGGWGTVYSPSRFAEAMSDELDREVAEGGALFAYPPIFAQLMRPLADVPLAVAFYIWSGLILATLALYWHVLRPPPVVFFYLAATLPVFATVRLGQSSWIGLLALTGAIAALSGGRRGVAGVALAAMVLRPQYLIGVGIWVLAHRRMRSLVTPLTGVTAGIVLVSVLAAPHAWWQYVEQLPDLLLEERVTSRFDYSLPAFAGSVTGTSDLVAALLTVALALSVAAALVTWLRSDPGWKVGVAAAVLASLLLSPHALVYDWILLLIPIGLFWTQFHSRRGRLLPSLGLLAIGASAGFLPIPGRAATMTAYIALLIAFLDVRLLSMREQAVAGRTGSEGSPIGRGNRAIAGITSRGEP